MTRFVNVVVYPILVKLDKAIVMEKASVLEVLFVGKIIVTDQNFRRLALIVVKPQVVSKCSTNLLIIQMLLGNIKILFCIKT